MFSFLLFFKAFKSQGIALLCCMINFNQKFVQNLISPHSEQERQSCKEGLNSCGQEKGRKEGGKSGGKG